ncbi:hypothetical protein [Nocardia sp. 348MFTsu5.1]|uniref:hypothetical protein n=1 Tax=Nocardia sp. 348MFTsu5.1 TaxID=1172185 RepID=UPI0018CBB591|nr:hypothetical protein [Nocardia sp. 348MFTsu5.1]
MVVDRWAALRRQTRRELPVGQQDRLTRAGEGVETLEHPARLGPREHSFLGLSGCFHLNAPGHNIVYVHGEIHDVIVRSVGPERGRRFDDQRYLAWVELLDAHQMKRVPD